MRVTPIEEAPDLIAHGALIRFVLLYAGLFSRSDWSRRSCRRSWPRAVFRLKTSGWCWAQEPIWLGAVCLLAASMATILVPAFPVGPPRSADAGSARVPWRVLFRRRAFVRVVIIAALVHGSHAMYVSFAVIRWTDVGIAPATTAVLWSESVAAEVLVFLFLGPRLLGLLNPAGALAVSAVSGFVRFGVMAQTADVTALARVQALHGFTFALLHLACMRIIADTVPRDLAGTAQAVYGLVGVGGATAVLTGVSGWLFERFGPSGFWVMAVLCILALPVVGSLRRVLQRERSHASWMTSKPASPTCDSR